jgi:hypothetical protein
MNYNMSHKNLPAVEAILTTTPPCPPVSLLKYCVTPIIYKNLPAVEAILTTTPSCLPVSLLKYCVAPLTYKTYLL